MRDRSTGYRRQRLHCSVDQLHRDCTSLTNLACFSYKGPTPDGALCGLIVVPGVKCPIGSDVFDGARALVGKSGKSQRLAHIHDFFTVYFITKERVPRSIRRSTVCRCQRLKQGQLVFRGPRTVQSMPQEECQNRSALCLQDC